MVDKLAAKEQKIINQAEEIRDERLIAFLIGARSHRSNVDIEAFLKNAKDIRVEHYVKNYDTYLGGAVGGTAATDQTLESTTAYEAGEMFGIDDITVSFAPADFPDGADFLVGHSYDIKLTVGTSTYQWPLGRGTNWVGAAASTGAGPAPDNFRKSLKPENPDDFLAVVQGGDKFKVELIARNTATAVTAGTRMYVEIGGTRVITRT